MNIVKNVNPFQLRDREIQEQGQKVMDELAHSPGIEPLLRVIQIRGNAIGELIGRDWRLDALIFTQHALTHQYGNASVLGKSLQQRLGQIMPSSPLYATSRSVSQKINQMMREMSPVVGLWDKSVAKLQKEMVRIQQARKEDPLDPESLAEEAIKSVKDMRPIDWLVIHLDSLNQAIANRQQGEIETEIAKILEIKKGMDIQKKAGQSMPMTDRLYDVCLARIQQVDVNGKIQHQMTTWSGWGRLLARDMATVLLPLALTFGSIVVFSKVDEGLRGIAGGLFGVQVGSAILTAMFANGLFQSIRAQNVPFVALSGYGLYRHLTE